MKDSAVKLENYKNEIINLTKKFEVMQKNNEEIRKKYQEDLDKK